MHNEETGRGRKSCKFFEELDAILGDRPSSVPNVLLDTAADYEEDEEVSGEMNTTGKCIITQ